MFKKQPPANENARLANLAMELGVAGTQILIEDFGFTPEQAQVWFDKMLARAKANRTANAQTTLDSFAKKGS